MCQDRFKFFQKDIFSAFSKGQNYVKTETCRKIKEFMAAYRMSCQDGRLTQSKQVKNKMVQSRNIWSAKMEENF